MAGNHMEITSGQTAREFQAKSLKQYLTQRVLLSETRRQRQSHLRKVTTTGLSTKLPTVGPGEGLVLNGKEGRVKLQRCVLAVHLHGRV